MSADCCAGERWKDVKEMCVTCPHAHAPMGPIERLRNGGQTDLADQVDAEIRTAYAAGRMDAIEQMDRIGATADCRFCGGSGERMVSMGSGPHIYQDLADCPDCKGTGYALPEAGWFLSYEEVKHLTSLPALLSHAKRAHYTNATVRKDGKETIYEADWIKHLRWVGPDL